MKNLQTVKNFSKNYFLQAALILIFGCLILPGVSYAASITTDQSNYTVAPGSTFVIPVVLTGANDIPTVGFDLGYDPAVLTYVSMTPGSFIDGGCALFADANEIMPGTVSVAISRMCGTGVTGTGVVANITMQAGNAPGTADITFANAGVCYMDTSCDTATFTGATVTVQAAVNNPPVISGVTANAGNNSAAVNWTTNEAATSRVDYGPTASYGSQTALNSTLSTAHSATISGLSENTTYHYRVRSADGQGAESVSADYTFTTGTSQNTVPFAGRVVQVKDSRTYFDFDSKLDANWELWQEFGLTRQYEFYRAYDAPFGFGSYSGAAEALGLPQNRWQAGIVTKNRFHVDNGTDYNLLFYAKASANAAVNLYLQNPTTYQAVTDVKTFALTGDWQRYIMNFDPSQTVDALVTYSFGDLPAGVTVYFDGLSLMKSSMSFNTPTVKGNIGDTNKSLSISNIGIYSTDDIEVELPYYDPVTGQATTKRYHPVSMTTGDVKINMPEGTFSGVGKVYVLDSEIGQFNYDVLTRITNIYPSQVRADEDVTIVGSGFDPRINEGKINVLVRTIDTSGKTYEHWLEPHTIDSLLKQVTVTLPTGIVNGNLYVRTNFFDKDDKNVVNTSNTLAYKVKPVIYNVQWSERGYEQVGDKLLIYGKGISNAPKVNFYAEDGTKIETKAAKVVDIYSDEVIEAVSTSKSNVYKVTVVAGGVESDQEQALEFMAKPKLTSMITKNKRRLYASNEDINAAKVGEEITVRGFGLKPGTDPIIVEFQGVGGRIQTQISADAVATDNQSLKVMIPSGVVNGYMNVQVNGEVSNSLPLEIIPTIESITPDPVVPGQDVAIRAQGVGNNLNLARVKFSLGNGSEVTVVPSAINYTPQYTMVYAKAPLSLPNQSGTIRLQYDNWTDDSKPNLNVYPTITNASFNTDTSILSIRGYGFSIKPLENKITYMYADESRTVINPKVKLLGVYPTEEGQEIRIQVLDDYHYGWVRVQVGDQVSNDANFGPVSISRIARRVEYVKSLDRVMGVLYISGYNFGPNGGVKVGDNWADVHYRSDFFIIAVIDQQYVYDNPVLVAKE